MPAAADDTPALRLVALLERIAAQDQLVTLHALAQSTGAPKPTLHRMLQQLEGAGLLRREADGRHYGTGARLRRLAENVLRHDSLQAARRRVLVQLVEALGESCNLTAQSGAEVVYLDRVETAAPLRFYLQPGSRVPLHASASGKLFLAQMPPAQRARLLKAAPLAAHTPNTLRRASALEAQLHFVRQHGYAVDDEEFLPGLRCVAVAVPTSRGRRSSLCLALQAPAMRLPLERVPELLPALQAAAQSLAAIAQAASEDDA